MTLVVKQRVEGVSTSLDEKVDFVQLDVEVVAEDTPLISDVVLREEIVTRVAEEIDRQCLSVGAQGPRGPRGEPGSPGGVVFEAVAGETLSALRVVYEMGGEVFALSPNDDESVVDLMYGLTTTAANMGGEISVQRGGVITDASWSFVPGPVWLGTGGSLTQVAPVDDYDLRVGTALSATKLLLDFEYPIDLGD